MGAISLPNDLGQRYDKEARFKFVGEASLAKSYIPIARLFQGALRNQLAIGNISAGSFLRILPDGTAIRCLFDGVLDIIEIDVRARASLAQLYDFYMYMESGYVDARAPGGSDETQEKAPWYPTPYGIEAVYKDKLLLGAGKDPVFNKEYEEQPAGAKSIAMPGGLHDKRFLKSAYYYPSKVTGKAKLWIQALLGRAPLEGLPETGEQLPLNKRTKDIIAELLENLLPPSFDSGIGLITFPDYKYWMVRVTRSSVAVAKILLDREASAIRDYLLSEDGAAEEDEARAVLEGFVLSGAFPYGEEIPIYSFDTVPGEPFAYGWKFNKQGSLADVITHELKFDDPGIEKHPRHVRSRRYQLQFNENPEYDKDVPVSVGNSPLIVALETIEDVTCTPQNNGDNVWVPGWFLLNMNYYYWSNKNEAWPEQLTYDAPMYCFYDSEDNYIELRNSYQKQEYDGRDAERRSDVFTNTKSCDHSVTHDEYKGYATRDTVGFYVQGRGADYRAPSGTGDYSEATVWGEPNGSVAEGGTILPRAWTTPLNGDQQCPYNNISGDDFPPAVTFNWVYTGMAAYSHRSLGDFSEHSEHAVIIPWYDSESFYVAKLNHENRIRSWFEDARNCIGWHKTTFTSIWSSIPEFEITAAVTSDVGWASGGGTLIGVIYNNNGFDTTYTDQIEMDLFSKRPGKINVATKNYTTGSLAELIDLRGSWAAVFDPILFGVYEYPYIDRLIGVQQSNYGELIYYEYPTISPYEEQVKTTLENIQPEEILYYGLFVGNS